MLERSDPISKLNAVSPNGFAFRVGVIVSTELAFPLIDGLLKLKRKLDFLSFDDDVTLDAAKERRSKTAGNAPSVLWAVFGVSQAVVVAMAPTSKRFLQSVNDGFVGHSDIYVNLHPGMTFGADLVVIEGSDSHRALSVEQTSGVANVELHRALDEKLANSEKARCPAKRRGRVTPNQAGAMTALGVRREQVPTAKAKICSELGRNVERLAEMTSQLRVFVTRHIRVMLTDCNSKYIFFRPYRERNFVALGDERMSTNQDAVVRLLGWAGNMTASGPQFCGVAIE